MKDLGIAERTHEANIQQLVREFGPRKEREIRTVYNKKREFIENNSSAMDFSAIITFKKTKEALLR